MTAYSSVDSAVEALKAGAYDYLTKPLDFEVLKLLSEGQQHARKYFDEHGLRASVRRCVALSLVSPVNVASKGYNYVYRITVIGEAALKHIANHTHTE